MKGNEPLLRLAPADYSRTRAHHDFGGGYSLRHAEEDFGVAWRFLDIHKHGACVVRVADVEQRPEALQLAAFSPGRPVQLRLEPDNPHDADAVGVWDESGATRVGHIARQNLYDARQLLFAGEPVQAIVLWDWRTEHGTRTGLDLLIAREGVVDKLDAPARRYERPPTRRNVRTAPAVALAAVIWVVLGILFGVAGVIVGAVLTVAAIVATRDRPAPGAG